MGGDGDDIDTRGDGIGAGGYQPGSIDPEDPGNLTLGSGMKVYGDETNSSPTTELTDFSVRYRYMIVK